MNIHGNRILPSAQKSVGKATAMGAIPRSTPKTERYGIGRAKLLRSAIVAAGWATILPLPAISNAQQPQDPPDLIVAISIDQFSGDLFAEYRARYRHGLARLSAGILFPRAYQGHSTTETCPGHSTILTGARPARTGIIGNLWYDPSLARPDKVVYCTEEATAPGSDSRQYRASPIHLKVPTLGDRMKEAAPGTRVVSVAGKDRAAILMGGSGADQTWWWNGTGFGSYEGISTNPVIDLANARITAAVATPESARAIPAECTGKTGLAELRGGTPSDESQFARPAGDYTRFRASPALDETTLQVATAFVETLGLGQNQQTDLLAIGLSASDVIGHRYGPGGVEMCLQQFALDRALGTFFDGLDRQGIDYLVVLTADHGGRDVPERSARNGHPGEQHAELSLTPEEVREAVRRKTGLDDVLIWSEMAGGNVYVSGPLTESEKRLAVEAARDYFASHPQVEAVYRHSEVAAQPSPQGRVDEWTLLERARMSFDPQRSGDLIVLLKPNVVPIAEPTASLATTHGSPWDNDRRVPILFWHKNVVPFEQPLPVETVDIAPTIAGVLGLSVPEGAMDGRCLDLIAGAGNSCP